MAKFKQPVIVLFFLALLVYLLPISYKQQSVYGSESLQNASSPLPQNPLDCFKTPCSDLASSPPAADNTTADDDFILIAVSLPYNQETLQSIQTNKSAIQSYIVSYLAESLEGIISGGVRTNTECNGKLNEDLPLKIICDGIIKSGDFPPGP